MSIIKIRRKTLSRLMAVQVIYQLYFYNFSIEAHKIILDLQDCYKNGFVQSAIGCYSKMEFSMEFLRNLVDIFIVNKDNIDSKIANYLEQCSYKINEDVHSFLRVGVAELVYFNTDAKVVIYEYVSIASSCTYPNKIAIINAILHKMSLEK